MVMPSSGALTMSQVKTELGVGNPVSLNDTRVRRLAKAAGSGGVAMSNMYGGSEWFNTPEYVAHYSVGNIAATSYTFSGCSLGAWTDATKIVLICIISTHNTASYVPGSITIAGVSATVIGQSSYIDTNYPMMTWAFANTTATSGNIYFSRSASSSGAAVLIFQLRGKNAVTKWNSLFLGYISTSGGQFAYDWGTNYPLYGNNRGLWFGGTAIKNSAGYGTGYFDAGLYKTLSSVKRYLARVGVTESNMYSNSVRSPNTDGNALGYYDTSISNWVRYQVGVVLEDPTTDTIRLDGYEYYAYSVLYTVSSFGGLWNSPEL